MTDTMKTQTMNRIATGFACALLLLPAALPAQDKAPAKKLYCWNENGRKICGDALPPEAADAARTEISAKSGMTVDSIARAQTAEERAAAELADRQAHIDADKAAAEQRHDLAMVESYNTEDDLRRAYGERITLVEESLKTSRLGMANLRQSLLSLLRKAAELELQSRPAGKPLTENIVRQHADLLRQQAILQQQTLDRASLGSDLEQALERYRKLKGGDAPPAGNG